MKWLRKVVLCGLTTTLISTTCLLLIVYDPPRPTGIWKYEFNINSVQPLILITSTPPSGYKELNVRNSSVSSESETFVPQNPCITNDRNQRNLSGKRLAKCTTKAEPLMLTYENPSQLGNQMCSYAALFAISRYNNRKAWMSPSMSDYISKYFNVSLDTLLPQLYGSIPWKEMYLGGEVPELIKHINVSIPYMRFGGIAQVRQYFDDFRHLIRKEFQFYDHIVQDTKSKLLAIKSEYFQNTDSATVVGIHVRRGDYLTAAQVEKFYVPTTEFYAGAMQYFVDKFKNVAFIVASNDIRWCEENLLPLKKTMNFYIHILQSVSTSRTDGGLDMAILAHCDHVIYGLGTFGFWAGYLNPGEVIYCADCITPTTGWLRNKLIYNGDYGNVVLPSWIGYSLNGTQSNELAKTTDKFKK